MSSLEKPQGLGQLKALLVGVNRYLESNRLSYCVQDALSLQEILSDSKYGMNERDNIKLMVDDSDELNKPTRNNILNNIQSLSRNAQIDDAILLFFAGHGMEIDNQGFILPSDFRQETGTQGGIAIRSIKEELVHSKAKFKLMFLDACHSGSVKGRAETGKMTGNFYNSLFPAPEGFAIFSSSKEQEYSYEWPEKEHGVFTFFLLEGLKGSGDENADGFVDILELHHYVMPQVQQWAFQNEKVQTPVIDANFSGILALTKAATVSAVTQTTVTGESDVISIILATEFKEMKLREYELGYGEEVEDSLREDIQKICGDLLLEFKPSKLVQLDDKTDFPAGYLELVKVTNEYRDLAKFRIEVHLDYSKKYREVTERIMNRLDNYRDFWSGIGFQIEGLNCDMDKLSEICLTKNYSIQKFQKKAPQKLTVKIGSWTDQDLIFTFIADDGLFIGVEPHYSSALSKDFYTLLNPKNILEVFGFSIIRK